MKKQPQRTAQTQANLIEAFWTLYQEKDIEKISVKAVTDLAGYNRGTFYIYFTNLYDVLENIEDTFLARLCTHIEVGLSAVAVEEAPSIENLFVEIQEEEENCLRVLLGKKRSPRFVEKLKAAIRPVLYANFSMRPKENRRVDLAVEFALSAVIGTVGYWYRDEPEMPSSEFIAMIRFMLSKGVLSGFQQGSGPLSHPFDL